jgi:hypothetical protein
MIGQVGCGTAARRGVLVAGMPAAPASTSRSTLNGAHHRRLGRHPHAVALEFHRLEIRLAGRALVAAAVLQHQVLAALAVRLDLAFLGDHGGVAALSMVLTNTFCTTVAERAAELSTKNTRSATADSRNWPGATRCRSSRFSKRSVNSLLLSWAQGVPTSEMRGHQRHQRQAEGQHRHDPARQRLAGGEPDDHLGIAVAARDHDQHRNKAGEDQDSWQIIQHRKSDERQHVARRDLAAGGLAEDGDQGPGDEDRKQDGEGGAGHAGQFTL